MAKRKEAGYNRSSFCEKFGIDRAVLTRIETNTKSYTIDSLISVCEVLELKIGLVDGVKLMTTIL